MLLAWDASAADLAVARWFGHAQGFEWRDSWWASTLLHSGGRGLAWVLLAALALAAVRTPQSTHGAPNRAQRIGWLGAMLLCLAVVPAAKRISATSCPWDLAEFGGIAGYVSHWQWQLADGGPGHCFPSGHAVAAFAFLGIHFMWRSHCRQRSSGWLLVVLAAGTVFGIAQLARGAHYPSHTLWSAWACWTVCACAAWLERQVAVPSASPTTRPAADPTSLSARRSMSEKQAGLQVASAEGSGGR